jgi:hypothetical protein
MHWQGSGRKQSWPNCAVLRHNLLRRTEESHEKLTEDSRYSNRAPPDDCSAPSELCSADTYTHAHAPPPPHTHPHTEAGWHRTEGILTRVKTACYATCICLFVASGCLCHYIQHTSWADERRRRNRAICPVVWTIVVHHHVHNSQQLNPILHNYN